MALLQSFQRGQASEHIFPSPFTGHPFASLFYPWDRIRRRAGLPDVRLHDLRHSFASFLVNRGNALGSNNEKITLGNCDGDTVYSGRLSSVGHLGRGVLRTEMAALPLPSPPLRFAFGSPPP